MRPQSFRFHPPLGDLEGELLWTLRRAFGPPRGRPPASARPERVRFWASALALRERIAGRNPRAEIESEIGSAAAGELWRAREGLAGRTLLLRELLGRVTARASEIGIRPLALKGIALLESGASEAGSRPLLDLDLLVAGDEAPALAGALEGAGMVRSGAPERHHLAPLADPRLGEVELHLRIPGLTLDGAAPATAEGLARLGLTRPSEDLDGLDLPARALMAAHALAHSLDQHGLSPAAYPVTRLVADLLDLGVEEPDPRLRLPVSQRECRAAAALCRALAAGEPRQAGADGLALLGHTVAAATSPAYRARLRRRAALRALRRGQWSKFRAEILRRSGRSAKLQ